MRRVIEGCRAEKRSAFRRFPFTPNLLGAITDVDYRTRPRRNALRFSALRPTPFEKSGLGASGPPPWGVVVFLHAGGALGREDQAGGVGACARRDRWRVAAAVGFERVADGTR